MCIAADDVQVHGIVVLCIRMNDPLALFALRLNVLHGNHIDMSVRSL